MFRKVSLSLSQSRLQSLGLRLLTSEAASMDHRQPLEEECLPHYNHNQFYPVHVGQYLTPSYKVSGKLGYSANSTVWLCRDTRNNEYVTIKVCTRSAKETTYARRELRFYEHVSSVDSQHPGQSFVRDLRETFELSGPDGQHLCLVHSPMHMTIRDLQYMNSSHKLNEQILRWTLSNILQALSYLHDEVKVTHADINPSNIMLTIADDSLLEDVEKNEAMNLLPRKVIDCDRAIYSSHKLGLPKDALWGEPALCDFGEARIGARHKGLIQPELYRAPEVLFDMEWDSKVDIWSLATMIWDLFGNYHLFNAMDEEHQSSATHHVAEMVGLLGLPPSEYIDRSDVTKRVFDDKGNWKGAGGATVGQISLEHSVSMLRPDDEQLFLNFVRKMLHWLPEERKRASELLEDPWLKSTV